MRAARIGRAALPRRPGKAVSAKPRYL